MNQGIYTCFIDFGKAFDKVQYQKLLGILTTKNIDSRISMYNSQSVLGIQQSVSELTTRCRKKYYFFGDFA